MRAPLLALCACVTVPPTVQAPITVVVQPASAPCADMERVLVDDALGDLPVDAGGHDG
jgi:hypothetical protein